MVSDFAAHPNHQMLLIALVEKNQITRTRLVEVAAEKLAVVLDQLNGVDVGPDLAVALLPLLRQAALFVLHVEFGRQVAVGEAIGAQPLGVVHFQRFIGGKTH